MSFGSTVARSAVFGLIYMAATWDGVAENDTTSPITNIYISLHESDPTAGNQTTGEGNYTSYARVAVVRSASGWSETAGAGSNDAAIEFPQCTGGSDTLSHVGTGTTSSGTGSIIIAGALTSSLAVSTNVQPRFIATALAITIA